MPRGDRTGPAGMGPRTGRAMGLCAGFNSPGYMQWGSGMGFGRGYGRGRGFRWAQGGYAPYPMPVGPWEARRITSEEEVEILKEEATLLKNELKTVQNKIKEFEEKK